MKKLLLILTALLIAVFSFAQNIGIGTSTPTDQLHTTGTVRFEGYTGTGTRLVQIDPTGKLTVNSTNPSFTNASPSAIPDNGCAAGTGISSDIIVSGQPVSIQSSKITVRINVTHTFDQDLRIYLYAPNGNILCLSYNTGASGDNFTNTIFTDAAVQNIGAGSPPFTGSYQPQGNFITSCLVTPTVGSFTAIGGGTVNPNGTWSLKIFDADAQDVGTLNSWDIGFSGPGSFITADQNNYIPKFSNGNLVTSQVYEDPTGNIGIGTTTPTQKFTVAGGMFVSGNGVVNGILNAGSVASVTSSTLSDAIIGGTVQVAGGSPAAGKVLTSSDGSGNATWQLPVSKNTGFAAWLASNTNFSQGTNILIPFSTAAGGGFDDGGGFINATSRFTAPQTGFYHFDAFLFLTSAIAGNNGTIGISLYKNNAFIMGNTQQVKVGDDVLRNANISWSMKMTAGEFVQFYFYQGVIAGNVIGQAGSGCTGYRVY